MPYHRQQPTLMQSSSISAPVHTFTVHHNTDGTAQWLLLLVLEGTYQKMQLCREETGFLVLHLLSIRCDFLVKSKGLTTLKFCLDLLHHLQNETLFEFIKFEVLEKGYGVDLMVTMGLYLRVCMYLSCTSLHFNAFIHIYLCLSYNLYKSLENNLK